MSTTDSTSTRPYLIRALYEWCTDSGFTPYVAVLVDDAVRVPREYVKNGEIVLNISFDATSSLKLGNEFIEFKARFAGTPREILVPVANVIAIYARENGQGMAFPKSVSAGTDQAASGALAPEGPIDLGDTNVVQLVQSEAEGRDPNGGPEPPKPPLGPRPMLKRVK
jgi:stringent starvation protein B